MLCVPINKPFVLIVNLRQLAKIPTSVRRVGRSCDDVATDADKFEMKLRDGDIVVLYVSAWSIPATS